VIDIDVVVARPALEVHAQISLPEHGINVIIGRNGAGKTTLMHAVAGLLRPSRGHVRIGERTLFDAARDVDSTPSGLGAVSRRSASAPESALRWALSRRTIGGSALAK
jgi:ABC-type molybdate transport system ATPase subunit